MSIIYDALNKTQQIRQVSAAQKIKQSFHFKWLIISICLLFCCCILLLLFFLFHQTPMSSISKSDKKVISMQVSDTKSVSPFPPPTKHRSKAYILNGVFLSNNNQLAIINHHYYHIGDQIDGMKVVSMNVNQVKLKDKNHILTLSMLH